MRKDLASFWLALFCCFFVSVFVLAEDLPKAVEEAKNGIVHIRSECAANGRILETREQTGFLVGEKGGEPCVITTCSNLMFSEADMKRLSKQHQLEENEQISTQIFMIFQGDVKYELGIVGKSDMLNLAALRPQQSLTDKYILEFAGSDPEKNQTVYFLCFPPEKGRAVSYSSHNVQASKTAVTEIATRAEGSQGTNSSSKKADRTQYFYHGVSGGETILGSPFVDEKGRVTGMIVGAELLQTADGGVEKDNRIALSGKDIMKFLDLHNVKYTEEKKAAIEARKRNVFPVVLGVITALIAVLTIVRMVRMNRSRAGSGDARGQTGPDPDATLAKVIPKAKAKNQPDAGLLRVATGEMIPVLYQQFNIGSVPAGNDYVISNNRKVSRKHACISFEKGKFYIEDFGSTNGTFIDEARLEPGRKQKLENGAQIRLADEGFMFRMK